MNKTTKKKIIEKLKKIESGTFQNDDIELFLINIREFARIYNFQLLLEFCDFVAHSDRNKGIICDTVDIVYSNFKYQPTLKGDSLNYDDIPKEVFDILFDKALNNFSDEWLIDKFGKNAQELKNYLKNKLYFKQGSCYKPANEETKEEIKKIQKTLHTIPEKQLLSEANLFSELSTCISLFCKQAGFNMDLSSIQKYKNSIVLCFLEIIQDPVFLLHDGQKAKGFITAGAHNNIYEIDHRIENLNLSFTIEIPIEQSFVIFEIFQTGIFIGRQVPEPETVIEWLNEEHTFGKFKIFNASKNIKKMPSQLHLK